MKMLYVMGWLFLAAATVITPVWAEDYPDLPFPQVDDGGQAYDRKVRALEHFPSEWFTCSNNDDCTLASVPCQTGLAVNKTHRPDLEKFICGKEDDCDADLCTASMIQLSSTECHHHTCTTLYNDPSSPDGKGGWIQQHTRELFGP